MTRRKLRSRSGSTLAFAMAVFLALSVLSISLIEVSLTGARAAEQRRRENALFHSVQSAAWLLQDAVGEAAPVPFAGQEEMRRAFEQVRRERTGLTLTMTHAAEPEGVTVSLSPYGDSGVTAVLSAATEDGTLCGMTIDFEPWEAPSGGDETEEPYEVPSGGAAEPSLETLLTELMEAEEASSVVWKAVRVR